MARRCTTSSAWPNSLRVDFRNLSRAGVAKKRSARSTRVPPPMRGRLGPRLGAGLDGQAPGLLGPLLAAGDGEPPDGADGRQRLATESQGGDMGQIVARQLGGGMALHRQGQLLGRHAETVIHHLDQIAPAIPEGDIDAPGAGVDGILHQLLHGRGRALDHLAGGDAVDDIGGAGVGWP
jgi:hypothetical protein